MSGPLTRSAYEKLIAEDIEWLVKQPDTLERQHIISVLLDSPNRLYGGGVPYDDGSEILPLTKMQMACPYTVCTTPYPETECYCALNIKKQEDEK